MATQGTFYIDNPDFSLAYAVYTDSTLTTPAPDGWYSFSGVVRRQVGGVLAAIDSCDTLSQECIFSVSTSVFRGVYNMTVGLGNDPSLYTGAVLIFFNPNNVANGIRATYGGGYYKNLTSPVDGFHGSSAGFISYTIIGNDAESTGASPEYCPNLSVNTSSRQYDKYFYKSNVGFVLEGALESLGISTSMVSLSSGASPGTCLMVIPRKNVYYPSVTVSVLACCEISEWDIEVRCPVKLTGFDASDVGGTCASSSYPNTIYNAPVDGSSFGDPSLYDFVFLDEYGETKVPAGDYKLDLSPTKKLITVDANGVITSISNCP